MTDTPQGRQHPEYPEDRNDGEEAFGASARPDRDRDAEAPAAPQPPVDAPQGSADAGRPEPAYPAPHDPQAGWGATSQTGYPPQEAAGTYGGGYGGAQPPGSYPPGAGQPGPSTWGGEPPQRTGMGVTALVLGIIALVLAFIPFVGLLSLLLGPAAVIVGIIAAVKRRGRGLGIGGAITGALGTIIALVMTIMIASSVMTFFDDYEQFEEEFGLEEGDGAQDQQDAEPGDTGDLPSELPSDLPSDFPTELPSDFPTELPSELREQLEDGQIDREQLDQLREDYQIPQEWLDQFEDSGMLTG